jgi:hypothetical protein
MQKIWNDIIMLDSYLSIWLVTQSSYDIPRISPVSYSPVQNIPNADFTIYGTTDEVSLINRVELDTRHCWQ